MKYEYLLFDLDGTITDSAPGITNAVRYALDRYDIHDQTDEMIRRFIGPPLVDSFQKYYGFSREKALEAVEVYREYYSAGGRFESTVYDGVRELLTDLKEAGYKLVLATAKPEMYTFPIMEHFDLAKLFYFIAGALSSSERGEKYQVIQYIMDEHPEINRGNAIMIGDREHDILGAAYHNMESVGVLYGYGSREEFQKAGATYIVEKVADLRKMFL